jgi:hypothetical protein
MKIINKKIDDLIPYVNNARTHSDNQVLQIAASIKEFGFCNPVLVDGQNGIIAGHGRVMAAQKLGMETVPTIELSHLSDTQRKAYILADNRLAELAGWDEELLKLELLDIESLDFDLSIIGFDDFDLSIDDSETISPIEKHNLLSDIFIVPPFSVLDTRQGYWQARKKHWKELIGDNGESREISLGESEETNGKYETGCKNIAPNVSLLDPVLSELVNHWFGFNGCNTFDCFAGDSVFGYVSSYMGNKFTGIELRQEQAYLNNTRIAQYPDSKYYCDDGQNVLTHIGENSQDLLFSCPPYFDLEIYSDLPNDASNQKNYNDFISILDNAFSNAIKCLKNNRFAVIVVGDVRDKKGFYYDFIGSIKAIFKKNGMPVYNEMILIEQSGTLAIRANNMMKNRKIGKCHQNVLVFFKGNPKKIQSIYPEIKEDYEKFAKEE